MRRLLGVSGLLLWLMGTTFLTPSNHAAAQTFELVEPNGIATGRIAIRRGRLLYWHGDGSQIDYRRDARFDTPDGQFLGYYNTLLARVLKFPRSGFGNFLYADLDDFFPVAQASLRQVYPLGSGPAFLPAYGPLVGGYAGFGVPHFGGGFGVPLVVPPPMIGFAPLNPFAGQPIPLNPGPLPIDTRRVTLPDLAPANLRLVNGSQREVNVTFADTRQPGLAKTFRLAPGGEHTMKVRRDAGHELIETFEVFGPTGDVLTQEIRTTISPKPRYEITVHEWRVQSIAIDRTARGNNAIEDVNMQGKGVGRFVLPAGPQLNDATIDVFQTARAMGNRGGVGPLVPEEHLRDQFRPSDRLSPLESILQQQREAARDR